MAPKASARGPPRSSTLRRSAGTTIFNQFFRAEGLIPTPVSEQVLANVWGTDLVNEVLDEIGRVPEN